MPEMIRHQRQVARLIMQPRPGRVPQRMNPFELDLSDPAGGLEPFVNRDA